MITLSARPETSALPDSPIAGGRGRCDTAVRSAADLLRAGGLRTDRSLTFSYVTEHCRARIQVPSWGPLGMPAAWPAAAATAPKDSMPDDRRSQYFTLGDRSVSEKHVKTCDIAQKYRLQFIQYSSLALSLSAPRIKPDRAGCREAGRSPLVRGCHVGQSSHTGIQRKSQNRQN